MAVLTYIRQQRGTNNYAVRMSGLSDEVARVCRLWLSHVFTDFAKGSGLFRGALIWRFSNYFNISMIDASIQQQYDDDEILRSVFHSFSHGEEFASLRNDDDEILRRVFHRHHFSKKQIPFQQIY